MYQLGGLSFSLGSEIAPGSSGDDSCPIHYLLRECEQWGMKGVGEGLLMLCHYGKRNLKDHKRKNISCSVLLRASLWTEEILCLTGLLMPVYVHPKKWSWDSDFPRRGMWGDYKFRYLENLKFKLGVDCWRPFPPEANVGFCRDLHFPVKWCSFM